MKIVILDGFTTVRNDLNWDAVAALGELTAYDRTRPEEVFERCQNAEIVLTNKVIMTAETIAQLPKLKYIGVLATGYNVVDLEAATKHGVTVTNIPAYSTDSVAQLIFAHLLNVVNRVDYYANQNREGRWAKQADMCFLDHTPFDLAGKQIAFIGVGNIGKAAIRIAQAFGMNTVAVSSKEQSLLPDGVRKVTAHEAFATSDVVALTCPLTENNRHMINAEVLSQMRPSTIVINTSRGPLVDEEAMATALKKGQIAAFCCDVVSKEPPTEDNPLFSAPNCYTTPHIAWATIDARQRLISICADNIQAFLVGAPKNVVN